MTLLAFLLHHEEITRKDLSPTRDEFTLHFRNLSSLQGFISQRLHLRPRYVSDAAGPKEVSDGKGCP